MIRFEHVSKAYLGGRQALQGVTFHMRPGEMAFLTGHSGAGKSTLLKLICGIERPSAGKIFFSGHDITRLKNREVPFLRRQIGMIFQDHHLLMVAAVFLVIGNSVRLSIFARRDTINVQKLIGATDGFILRPFLYGGALLGFSGAFLSLILSEILVMRLSSAVTEVAQVFGTKFDLNGLSFDECLLLLLVCSMIGWIAAWLATVQHLRHFTPD